MGSDDTNVGNRQQDSSDPRVVQWLEHVVKNDTDEKVRAEATRALEAARRLANGQGQGQQGQADTVVRLQ